VELTKLDIKKIVNDEIKSFIIKDLDKEIAKILKQKSSQSREVSAELVKDGIQALASFLYIRRSIWRSDIK